MQERLVRGIRRVVFLGIAAAAALASPPSIAHDRMGANLNFIGDFRRNHEFADLMKQSRLFLRIGEFNDQEPASRAPVGPDGWPTSDFRVLAMSSQSATQSLAGNYTILYTHPTGGVVVDTAGGGAGTITSNDYNATTRTGRAVLNFPAGGDLMLVNFSNTGGQVKDVRILRPTVTNPDSPPFLNATWKAHAQRFPTIRFLDWTRTNGNRDVSWADRTTPEKRRTEQYIAQWETVIEAANWLNRDPWINIPVQANDEYVTNLAILLRDRLNANLNVYVEYGNELWNFAIRDVDMDVINGGDAFNGATVNANLARQAPPDSPLRFGGESDDFVLAFRRVGLRLAQISDIFRTVWGDAAINTRVRPVLAGQMANPFIVTEGLRLIDEGLNRRPQNVIYALSGAPYIFPSATPDGEADEAPGLSSDQILDGLAAGVANAPVAYSYETHAALGAWYGVKVVAYEAGFDNFGGQNIAAKREANLAPRIQTLCEDFVRRWVEFGFEQILWFNAGADGYDTPFGMWPLVEDMATQDTPKNRCMNTALAAPLPSITGVGVPAVGAAIAGGNFRGSTNSAGTLQAASTPDFGFPGFVEYLISTDVAGTYSLTFRGTATAGEVFRVLLNNAEVAAGVQLPATLGNASPLTVTLRRGLNALRIARVGGGSWVMNSFTFALVGDSTPDAFSFVNQTGVAPGTEITSAPITVLGITIPAAISVAGGTYAISATSSCSGPFTANAGTVTAGQFVCVRHTSAAVGNTPTVTTLTVGGVSASFTSTTQAAAATQTLAVTRQGNGTVTSSPAGVDCGSTCSANFPGGTLVTLTPFAAGGSAFAGWEGACTGTGVCQVTMLGARSVTARFAATAALAISSTGSGRGTVTSTPAGIDCGATCSFTFTAGASVTLTATPSTGSTFSGWGGACAGAVGTTCQVTVAQAATVTASFTLNLYPVSTAANPPGSGVVVCDPNPVPHGSNTTCRATANAGFSFAGWSGDCTGQSGTTCTLTSLTGARSATASFSPVASTRLTNISTRGQVLAGTDVMIGGFVVGGATPKRVLITARGPSLGSFGIANPLANPKIELFSGQTKLMENDNWQAQSTEAGGSASVAAIQALGIFPNGLAPSNANEAALLVTLAPGAYTAVVSGADGGTGVGIVEVFEQDGPSIPLINISTRGRVGTSTDVMIGGFVVTGSTPQTVLITARGPSLSDFGIAVPLANPKLEIFSGQTKIYENDNWQAQAAVPGGATPSPASSISALGTFPNGLAPSNANEAALLVTLPPGAYTAVVSGVSNGTGVAIVEVFAR